MTEPKEGTRGGKSGSKTEVEFSVCRRQPAYGSICRWIAGSWSVFIITAAILLVLNLHAGDIRPNRRR